jgi:protein-S-isoprenylcysteine O-methyltransferase Ste14
MKLAVLVGNGRKIGLLTAPFLVIGLALNLVYPRAFAVGGPPGWLLVMSLVALVPGIINWAWSVFLILTEVPRKKLITRGPYSVVKHPLYMGVGMLVLPWIGFLCDSWLGLLVGAVVCVGSRLFSPGEEEVLRKIFGDAYREYEKGVLIPWL